MDIEFCVQVLKDLPVKTEALIPCAMSPLQCMLYSVLRSEAAASQSTSTATYAGSNSGEGSSGSKGSSSRGKRDLLRQLSTDNGKSSKLSLVNVVMQLRKV
jgi:SNF2 family DNA or RNA helicase